MIIVEQSPNDALIDCLSAKKSSEEKIKEKVIDF